MPDLPASDGFGLQQRVTGAELRRLDDELDGRATIGQRGAHVVGAVADDEHGGRGLELVGGSQHVFDNRPAGQRVQHLRPGGLHPRALAGGENHDVESHLPILSFGHEPRREPSSSAEPARAADDGSVRSAENRRGPRSDSKSASKRA